MATGAINWFETQGQSQVPADEDSPRTTHNATSNSFQPLGDFLRLGPREISEYTTKRFKYGCGLYNGQPAQLVNVYDGTGKELVAQKVRMKPKDFRFFGDTKAAGFIFQNVFKENSSRKLIICEGEIDAMSIYEATEGKWACVSLPNGTQSVKKTLANSFDYIMSFKEVVIAFDSDEAGREATAEATRIIGPKALIAAFPEDTDASDIYVTQGAKAVLQIILNAQAYKPEGIVTLRSLRDTFLEDNEKGIPWIYNTLTEATYGRRAGEVYVFGAGSGVGKTDFFLQQAVADIKAGFGTALFLLEQPVKETAKRLTGKYSEKIYHVPEVVFDKEEATRNFDELTEADNAYLFNHFGSKDWDSLKSTIRWLASTQDTKHFYIDHLTALVALEDDERRALERIMAEMAGLAQELDINLYVISHLSTPDGTPHEEGGRVMAKHFKGSRSIIYWAHFMFAFERNTQAEDPLEKTTTTMRVLKDRFTGKANGLRFYLGYDDTTGQLYEHQKDFTPDWLEDSKGSNNFTPQGGGDF